MNDDALYALLNTTDRINEEVRELLTQFAYAFTTYMTMNEQQWKKNHCNEPYPGDTYGPKFVSGFNAGVQSIETFLDIFFDHNQEL